MPTPFLGRTPAVLFAATVGFEVAAVVLSWGREPVYDTLLYAAAFSIQAFTGALVAARHPRNPVGWLLLANALVTAVTSDAAQGWALRGWPGRDLAEASSVVSWMSSGALMIASFLLFPTGRFRHRWSKAVLVLGFAGAGVAVPATVLAPESGGYFAAGVNPYGMPGPWQQLLVAALVPFLGAVVLSIADLLLRFRRAAGIERQQLKWVALSTGVAAVLLPIGVPLWNELPIVRAADAIVLTAIPVSMAVAILRYRLYDIDLVVTSAVVYAGITAMLAATYALTAVIVGAAGGRGSIWATAVVTLVAVLGARPLRDRLQRGLDRRFNRAKYDALQRVEAFVADLRVGTAEPEAFETVLQDALGDPGLRLWLRLPATAGYVDLAGTPVADSGTAVPIRLSGATIGGVALGSESALARARLPDLIAAGGLAVEIVRLRVELRRQLNEVAASRARIALAADEERRRIERDLHDGHQQRLVSIGLSLRHAQHALGGAAPQAHAMIERAVDEITSSIDELRELARGLRPTQLDAGLAPALRDLARRVPIPVEVHAAARRFPTDVEAAAYFTACEGITNAVKHSGASRVVVRAVDGGSRLVLSVQDDGIGGAVRDSGSGLTGLRDRVAVHGGHLELDSPPGCGTTLTAVFPCVS